MRIIRPYFAIFRKEVKSVSALLAMTYVLALSIYVVMVLYDRLDFALLFRIPQSKSMSIRQIRHFIYYSYTTILFLFPVILTYSLNAEWLSGSRFQRLSLPVRPSSFLLVKFAVICIAAAPLSFLFEYIFFLPWGPLVAWIMHRFYGVDVTKLSPWQLRVLGPLTPSFLDYFAVPFSRQFALHSFAGLYYILKEIVLYSGLVCFAQAVSTIFRQFRFPTWVFAFLAGLAAYSICYETFRFRHADNILLVSAWFIGFPLIGGLIFLAVGLILFEKYAEV